MNLRWMRSSIAGPMVFLSSLALFPSVVAAQDAPETTSQDAPTNEAQDAASGDDAEADDASEDVAEDNDAGDDTENADAEDGADDDVDAYADGDDDASRDDYDDAEDGYDDDATDVEDHVAVDTDVPADDIFVPVGVVWNAQKPDDNPFAWTIDVGGFIRTQFTTIENDPDFELYGRNDGFVMANARLSLLGSMGDNLGFALQLDGAVDRDVSGSDRPVTEVNTSLEDANIWWEPVRYTRLRVGQFKPAFDIEERLSTAELLFIDRSVGSRGVSGVEGFNVAGLSRDREVGASLSARPLYFGGDDLNDAEGFGVGYEIAVTNGQTANYTLNDNDKYAGYGRLELLWGDMVRLGGAVAMNDETIGVEAADQTEVSSFAWTADLTVNVAGLTVVGNMIQTQFEYAELAQQPTITATAYMAQIGYEEPFFGFQPVFRLASYDPSSSVDGQTNDIVFENDARTFYTFGLNYNPRYPIRLMLNYTVTQEEEARELDNNRFDALMQVTW